VHFFVAQSSWHVNCDKLTKLQKQIIQAAYKVGGRSINAHTIEYFILRCRSHRPSQVQIANASNYRMKLAVVRYALCVFLEFLRPILRQKSFVFSVGEVVSKPTSTWIEAEKQRRETFVCDFEARTPGLLCTVLWRPIRPCGMCMFLLW
jgi:hypothetical protein